MAPRRGPERDLQDTVIEMAMVFGWRCIHLRPARVLVGGRETYRTAGQGHIIGFPDVVAVRGERLVVIELKSEKGKVTREQREWLDAWAQISGAEVYEWRPSDIERITAVLS